MADLTVQQSFETAKAFLDGNGSLRQFSSLEVEYAMDTHSLAVDIRQGKIPLVDFIGGVTFALAAKGEIAKEDASVTNVSRVCLALGVLLGPTLKGTSWEGL